MAQQRADTKNKDDNMLMSLKRNTGCIKSHFQSEICIFNVISGGENTSKPGVNTPVALYSEGKHTSILRNDDFHLLCVLGISTLHNVTRCV